MASRLTVIIPCKNERRNIRPCIEAARLVADELLIADSGSTDGTLEIIGQLGGCRLVQREYVHSGDFKNWAIPQAACEWVLIVDADERVTPALAAEIRDLLATPPACDGYWIGRNNYFLGRRIYHSGWGRDRVLRLFRRDEGRYVGDTDHAEVAVRSGRTGRLQSRLEHYTYWTYDQYFQKFHRYTTWQAGVWYRAGRRPSLSRLILSGPLRFLRAYVLQLGFLDGLPGFQLSVLQGFYSFMKQARLWEQWYAVAQPDPEAEAGGPGRVWPASRPAPATDTDVLLRVVPIPQPWCEAKAGVVLGVLAEPWDTDARARLTAAPPGHHLRRAA
jgi:glycosyltransferase involved in cell wall biosynthesis